MERNLFHTESISSRALYRRSNSAHSRQPQVGGADVLQDVPRRAQLYKEVQQAGVGRNLQALELGKVHYTFIKNTIPVVAEEVGTTAYNTAVNEQRNKGAFVMDASSMDIETLLSHSQKLVQNKRKDGEK